MLSADAFLVASGSSLKKLLLGAFFCWQGTGELVLREPPDVCRSSATLVDAQMLVAAGAGLVDTNVLVAAGAGLVDAQVLVAAGLVDA